VTERALRVFHVLLTTDFGGVETYTEDLFDELERRGHENVILYAGRRETVSERARRTSRWWPSVSDFLHGSTALRAETERIISTHRPDVAFIHACVDDGLAGAIVDRLPTVYFAHTYNAFCPSGARFLRKDDTACSLHGVPDGRCLVNAYRLGCNTRRPATLWRSYRRAAGGQRWIRRAHAVVCDSQYVARQHLDNGFPSQRFHVLPSPVRLPESRDPGAARQANTILFVGRLTPGKGLQYLIRALPRIASPVRLLVAGSGGELPELVALARREQVLERVDFLGRLDREALEGRYETASLVVVPSVWPEPFGMVGPEAMAHGLPVVAFRVGGIPEWLTDGETGFLVEPKDLDGLADRIDTLLQHPAMAQAFGATARAAARERFSVERHVDGLLPVFRESMVAR
jgi:glycosyltransferase involved in cell wall biosynthesis